MGGADLAALFFGKDSPWINRADRKVSRIAYEFKNCLYGARVRSSVSTRSESHTNLFPMAWRWIACRGGIGPRGAVDKTARRDGVWQSSSASRWPSLWRWAPSSPSVTALPRKLETQP